MQLGLTSQRDIDGELENQAQNGMLSTGIELFKQSKEAVVDICFDRTGTSDMLAMAI